MARTRVRTLLPLDTWVKIIGIDPRHFNQVTTSAKAATSCATVWKQHAWQESNQVGREDVAIAIAQAEQLIAEHVGYRLLPTWEVDERQRITSPGIPDVFNVRLEDPRQFPMSVKTDYGHLISGGIEGKTLIAADAPVTFEDLDGDGFCETATVQVTTTLTDPTEIAVYFPGEDGRDDWEVRPLHNPRTGRRDVTITAGIATIVMATEQLVDPDLWEALDPDDVDGAVLSNFTATVDVYRHFNDPQTQEQTVTAAARAASSAPTRSRLAAWSPRTSAVGGGSSSRECSTPRLRRSIRAALQYDATQTSSGSSTTPASRISSRTNHAWRWTPRGPAR